MKERTTQAIKNPSRRRDISTRASESEREVIIKPREQWAPSTALASVMARSSLITTRRLLTLLILLHFGILADARLTVYDEYEWPEDYFDLTEKEAKSDRLFDDLYIASDEKIIDDRSHRRTESTEIKKDVVMNDNPNSEKRVYRYTKHRIPGYDYDELDYYDRRCDSRSVWTHCMCQFTCDQPNIVDCYTPCNSGCECREDYVYDERTEECVSPDQCSPDDQYMIY